MVEYALRRLCDSTLLQSIRIGIAQPGDFCNFCSYPAAMPIRQTTRCQYSVAAPMSAVAMEKTMMAVPMMAVRGSVSAIMPLMMRKQANMLANAEPARI